MVAAAMQASHQSGGLVMQIEGESSVRELDLKQSLSIAR
jgi:hypothetical protein